MSEGRIGIGHRLLVAVHGSGHYLWRYQVAPLLKVAALLRRIWTLGAAERVVFIGAVALSLIAAATLTWSAAGAVAMRSAAHLGLFVLIWSVTLAAAAAQPGPAALTVVAPWLIFYVVLAASAWAGRPLMVLPVAWVAWTLYRKLDAMPSRVRAVIWWCVAAAGLAYVSAGPSGLRRWLGWTPSSAQTLLGVAIGAAGSAALCLTRARPRPHIGFSRPFAGALILSGTVIASAAVKDWALTVDWTSQMVGDAGAILVLFWMWIGGSAGAGSLHFAEWCARLASRIVPGRALVVLAPVVVSATALIEWMLLREPALPGSELRAAALIGHLFVSVVTALWLGSALARRRLTRAKASAAVTWWGLAWLVMQAVRVGGDSVVASRAASQTGTALVVVFLVIGLLSELGALQRAWMSLPEERIRRQLGFVVATVGCAVVLSTMPGGDWQEARTLMVLMGVAHLALPVALYERLRPRAAEPSLGNVARAAMFAGGYGAALIVMAVEPRRSAALLVLLPVLAAALMYLRQTSSVKRAGGAFAGALFGSGVIAGWMMPYPPTIPFVHVPAWITLLRDWGALGRPPLTWQHASLVVAAWTLAGGLGWLVCRPPAGSSDTNA